MPVFKVNVKWTTQRFKDLEVNTDSSPQDFKALLFSLTGVPPDRQKVMMPGGLLGDTSFDRIKLKDGVNIMMMGSAEAIPVNLLTNTPVGPAQETKKELEKVIMPHGLVNLGNTCYMNGSIQLLFTIPEFRTALANLSPQTFSSMNMEPKRLLNALKGLFVSLEKADEAVVPHMFLAALHGAFPQFATMASGGPGAKSPAGLDPTLAALAAVGGMPTFQQQDANECWTEIVRIMQRAIIDSSALPSTSNIPASLGTSGTWNPIDRFLTGHLSSTLACTEGDEPSQESVDTFSQLSCFIDKDVKYLHTGIRNGLEGTLTKRSEALGREAEYKKISQISRLPGYLCIQFVRFFYKEKEKINAKILKDIKFPMNLDLYEFCTKDLQSKLLPMREKVGLEDEAETLAVRERKITGKEAPKPPNPEDNPELYDPYWLTDDLGSNNTGYYELQGVLTHQGRSSSSGHYVGWVKVKDKWFKMDDDKVSEVTPEEILKLSGGGDWHCAYLLLYGPRRVKKETPVIPGAEPMDTTAAK